MRYDDINGFTYGEAATDGSAAAAEHKEGRAGGMLCMATAALREA